MLVDAISGLVFCVFYDESRLRASDLRVKVVRRRGENNRMA